MASSALSRLANLKRHFQPRVPDKGGNNSANGGPVKISPDVSEALSRGQGVVALESTIITHGMPYPQNLETAKEVEAIVRENGAVPATIAILDGVPCVGGYQREWCNHCFCNYGFCLYALQVGIPVFVTGGIGGVHRHGEQTMDISSDLTELGRTPVAVISAGVKSILDIPKTLEYLETQGVSVATYKTNEFPAFFTESSGCKVPCRVDTPEQCARLIVPIPKEHSASGSLIESAIQTALSEARDKNITGNAATPFLLARVNQLTGGASLTSNIALVKNNALVGAQIAVALAQLQLQRQRTL